MCSMQIQDSNNVRDAADAIAEAADSLSAYGSLRCIKSLADKDALLDDFLHYYFIDRMQSAVCQ
jgi:hypothetical protein